MGVIESRRTVIVTGGACGIGKAICVRFASEDANIIIADKDEKMAKHTFYEISKLTRGKVEIFVGDLSEENVCKELIEYVVSKFGEIDVLVNNIGLFNGKGLDASEEEWFKVFKTNVLSYVWSIKYAVPFLKERKGNIVNIASISGVIAQPNYLVYSTSKSALINMVKCLALDLAEYNIRVNNICPATVWSENNAYYIKRDYDVDFEGACKHPEIGGKHPIGRVATTKEIANAVYFLASKEATFITGVNLMVDGGYTIV